MSPCVDKIRCECGDCEKLRVDQDSTWQRDARKAADAVNHPPHYNSHPSGVEVITITEHMNFCLGNAVKYILRCDLKNNAIEDLNKAIWYIDREIARRTKGPSK